MRLTSGTRLGPYEIQALLGAGGMGEVYKARDTRLGRDVAIKVIAATPDADLLTRFERETHATAVLAHPNILTVFDVGSHEGLPFLVSELLEGQTLGGRLKAGPVPAPQAIELALQLVRGVAAAHALRIIHRDLKPENLFVTARGTLKILDFGLAKLKPAGYGDASAPTIESSDPHKLLGTPAYMSPEQLRGAPPDERADIFAIGTILFEMMAGRHPFRKDTAIATLSAILHDAPAALASGTDLAPAVARVIRHCLEKDPVNRFQSADDLAFALESIQGELHPERAASTESVSSQPVSSIAVLPFVDMSPTRDQEYLCEGIAEELINVLTQIPGLRVAARSSSFQFKASAVDVRAVGARLGVAAVLEGGVRKAGDRLRVTVQLVDVDGGHPRWSHRFDGKLEDVFAIQDEIAERVAGALGGMLTDRQREALRRPETTVETYEYFLRGRQLLNHWRGQALVAAKQMFQRSIEIDPRYAPAYAGLAQVHASFYTWWGGNEADFEAADQASLRALELGPDLAEAYASRGFVLFVKHDYEAAERAFVEAIRLNPKSFEAYYLSARMNFEWGRIERSVELFRRAADVRQEDFQSPILLAQSLRVLGKSDEARQANREGVRKAERQLELDPSDVRALSHGALALFFDGQRDRAMQWSAQALILDPEDGGVLINGACLRALAGLKTEALDLLEKTFARGWGSRDWIEHDPDYESLRGDPRFQAMIAKLK